MGISCPIFSPDSERINDVIEFDGKIFLASNYEIKSFNGKSFNLEYEATEPLARIRSLEILDKSQLICGTDEGAFVLDNGQLKPFELKGLPYLNISDLKNKRSSNGYSPLLIRVFWFII